MRMRRVWVLYTSGLLFAVWSAGSLAAPAVSGVSGTIAHGQQLQISGSSFGQKSPAKPYLWAPFEGSANPSSLGIRTSWDQVEFMTYAPGEGINGSGALRSADSGGTWTAAVVGSGFAWNDYNQKMYLFRRVKQNFSITMNWKILRLWPASGGQPNWYIAANNGDWSLSPPSTVDNTGYPYGPRLSILQGTANTWKTEEILTKSNSATNMSDAIFQHYVHGALIGQFPYTGHNLRLKQDGWAPIAKIYAAHGVMANVTIDPSWKHWTDDIYLDTTWARVIVGNAPNLQNCTLLDIQIPFEWSAGQIGVTLNLGSFPDGQPRYLFVVDANGSPSSGYSLGESVVPLPPTNVNAE